MYSTSPVHESSTTPVSRLRFAGLAGRLQGDPGSGGRPFVFLHGLTFDRSMWNPVLDALPDAQQAVAFDLPGHGRSPALPQHNLEAVVDAIHQAVLAAGLDTPIVVGHSIGGPLAAIYAVKYPAAAVVSIEAPVRLEPFAELLRSLAPQLTDSFDQTWSRFQDSFHLELVPAGRRTLLRAGEQASREIVLGYQSDLLERPLDEVVRWHDDGLRQLRAAGVPYLALHSNPVDPTERAWLADRLPQAEIVVWPVGHHFPHLADPDRFAALLTQLAAGLHRRP